VHRRPSAAPHFFLGLPSLAPGGFFLCVENVSPEKKLSTRGVHNAQEILWNIDAARAREDEHKQQLNFQIDSLLRDENELEQAYHDVSDDSLPRNQKRSLERKRNKLKRRELILLSRDDDYVRDGLVHRKPLWRLMSAQGPTNCDDLMYFLVEELKLTDILEALCRNDFHIDPITGKTVLHRQNYASLTLNMVSLISRFLGFSSQPDMDAVLLADERWMELLGFNAAEVESGASARSIALTGMTRQGRGGSFLPADDAGTVRTRPQGPRGAFSPQTVADHEAALPADKLSNALNAVVRRLAELGYFEPRLRTVTDTTDEEVPPSFEGAGKVTKKVKVDTKARRPKKVKVTLLGFKVWYLMDVKTGIPLAFFFDTIERPDNEHAKALVSQAIKNLEGYATIVSIALDRGFMDGDLLWWLKEEKGIDWVCPSKERMAVTDEARTKVWEALQAASPKFPEFDDLPPTRRELAIARRLAQTQQESQGVRFAERKINDHRDTLVVAEAMELTFTDFYGKGGSNSSRLNSKKYRPTPLHATVVLNWADVLPQEDSDDSDSDGNQGPLVILSPLIEGALPRFDRYDERSLIENKLNRTIKQHFGLGAALSRNASAMLAATVFSTIALLIDRAFRIHLDQMYEVLDKRGERLGVLRYHRQETVNMRHKVIIAMDDRYGILHLREFAKLAGLPLLDARPTGESPEPHSEG